MMSWESRALHIYKQALQTYFILQYILPSFVAGERKVPAKKLCFRDSVSAFLMLSLTFTGT